MKEYFKSFWKKLTNDYKIEIKNVNIVSPYVIIIDFTTDQQNYYLIMEGRYQKIRKIFLSENNDRKNNNFEPISFIDWLPIAGIFIPVEDIVIYNKKKWKKK